MTALELPIYDRELEATRARLSRIEGQVRGVSRMLGDQQSCLKVLQQLASVQAALRGVTKTVLRNCLERCAGGKCGDPCNLEELMDVIYKFAK
jgi:DNA-binding FrmR family transcriptional regulator